MPWTIFFAGTTIKHNYKVNDQISRLARQLIDSSYQLTGLLFWLGISFLNMIRSIAILYTQGDAQVGKNKDTLLYNMFHPRSGL